MPGPMPPGGCSLLTLFLRFNETVHVLEVKVLPPANANAGEGTAPNETPDAVDGDPQIDGDGLEIVQPARQGRGFRRAGRG